ncbi:hypothetical protein C5748_25125 [Phyllobacterium phragmitis]|uniref:Tyrosine specific protein phosphatases domain-containing protein n=2 Tax=Phyllobacterium phragmitis TaxID=2670329 RepID=A0A2S9IJR9_9HYPH|nr:hypothetical protein C5748_25125 [Phyllobacterium phragmitis]
MDLETSIRAQIAVPKGGGIVTMGFPGLAFAVTGDAYIDPERMRATLVHPALERCDVLIVLVEPEELPPGAMEVLQDLCADRDISVLHLPIADYQVPGDRFAAGWETVAGRIDDILQSGGTLALSCHYGAGRSGMIAAGLLLEQGLPLSEAILAVREQFPESIESDVQLAWLADKHAALSGARATAMARHVFPD